MKISMIPPPSLSTSTMKPPFVCSVPVPSLMDINPFTPPEFHFPSQDMEMEDQEGEVLLDQGEE